MTAMLFELRGPLTTARGIALHVKCFPSRQRVRRSSSAGTSRAAYKRLTVARYARRWPNGSHLASAHSEVLSVVLVHGAFVNGSSWSRVVLSLAGQGIRATAAHCPLTSLAHDAAAAQRAIEMQAGPVLLVGHAWGGAVISEAGRHPKVAGLVYVAAAAPDSGQSLSDWWKDYPAAEGRAEMKPYGDGFVALTAKGMREDFAPDLPAADVEALLATQAPFAMRSFGDRVVTAAWRTKPSWYVVAENDRMVPPVLERASAAQMTGGSVMELQSSHVPMLSQAAAVADFIADAIEALEGEWVRHGSC